MVDRAAKGVQAADQGAARGRAGGRQIVLTADKAAAWAKEGAR